MLSLSIYILNNVGTNIGGIYFIVVLIVPLIFSGYSLLDIYTTEQPKKGAKSLGLVVIVLGFLFLDPHITSLVLTGYEWLVG